MTMKETRRKKRIAMSNRGESNQIVKQSIALDRMRISSCITGTPESCALRPSPRGPRPSFADFSNSIAQPLALDDGWVECKNDQGELASSDKSLPRRISFSMTRG